jgi:hypothetical protein
MRLVLSPFLLMVGFAGSSLPCGAQSLSSRPGIFADPLLTSDPSKGDLVLGQTTLTAALRIFAVELRDSVRLPLGHASNPDTLPSAAVIAAPVKARPYYRLELGPKHYTLYFDRHERLIAVVADRSRFPRALRREDLVARYATLRAQSPRNASEIRPSLQWLGAELAPCVSAGATVWDGDDGLRDARHMLPGTVIEFGYGFTCNTIPSPTRAALDWEP